ncbi:MAG: DNA repair protein RecN [Prevotella sp.]|nr:DNA repair protein RecN [Prevotella sp.]
MLKRLYIKDYTLIDVLDIEFDQGFSVITGETGAGKSIILGALGLILGRRADAKEIKTGATRCCIEAHFDLSNYAMQDFFDDNDIDYDAEDCIIRRELTSAGKSRSFINDTPASLALLKELGERLVDIHSQHQNLLLNKHDFQLSVIDIIADDQQLLTNYHTAYTHMHDLRHRLETLQNDIEQSRQNADFLQFQFNELCQANLSPDEQEELEQRSDTMTHAEDIKSALYEADTALSDDEHGVVSQLKKAYNALSSISNVLPQTQELAERMDTCYIELKDMAQEVGSRIGDIDFDPSELDAVNNRLDRIYELEKKYHCQSVDELLTLQEELKGKLGAIENSDEALAELQQALTKQQQECERLAASLTKQRTKAARLIEKDILQRLMLLGMPHVRFEISIMEESLGPNGHDKVAFLFSANKSMPMQPVSQIASGGEIARVMLALKTIISNASKLPTIIFDEIDTGVSGKTAECMAQMMQEMGQEGRQVISITHLPQIAALGSTHYKVYKEETAEGTHSHMKRLDNEERIREIAQMLSGSDISEAAVSNAKELLRIK